MMQLIMAMLVAGGLFAVWRWKSLDSENTQLRAQVASLKRQLARFGRDR